MSEQEQVGVFFYVESRKNQKKNFLIDIMTQIVVIEKRFKKWKD